MSHPAKMADDAPMPGRVLDHAYILPAKLTKKRWQEIGMVVMQMHRSANWWVGDWYIYGEQAWGEDVAQATADYDEASGESLRQAIWVAEKFPFDRRQPRLSWTHHRIAAGVEAPLRYQILELAAAPDPVWSTRRLQEHIDGLISNLTPIGEAAEVQPPSNKAGPADLTEEALEAMIQHAVHQNPHDSTSFAQGWVEALRWKLHREHFTRWVE